MHYETPEECRRYVEAELDRVVRSRPDWMAVPNPQMPGDMHEGLSWNLAPASTSHPSWQASFYTLEARMRTEEFLLWFGNHAVGAENLHWIIRPAVHVAFNDLWPRNDVLGIRFSLGDVLEVIIGSLDMPSQFLMRFPLNFLSAT
jgi:hypothetical protein